MSAAPPPFLIIEGLTKVFLPEEKPALDHLCAGIPKGKIVGLVGPDGAGKTTLIRLIGALLKPSQGKIVVDGRETMVDPEYIHEISGYMPQKFGLYEDLTVLQNLTLHAELRGVLGKERQEAFARLFHFTGLTPFKDRLARALSGGMKQKLGLACALIKTPRLLLLDEPSVGVDPLSRRELWKMVQELVGSGISVIWSTAYLDEAERCDTVLLLNEGKLVYDGLPNDLTRTMEGRVFLVTCADHGRRKVLKKILQDPNVIDGVIQGRDLRVVVKAAPLRAIEEKAASSQETPPRFEDAFMEILGGGPGGASILADQCPKVEGDSEKVIIATDLVRKFGSFVAANKISFTVRRGEVFGLLGPNGAGKSTTFKMLCGLLTPTSGHALINGLDVQKTPSKARGQLGYMAQKFSLYGQLTVKQNLDFFSHTYNLHGALQRQAVEKMIEIFDLKPYLDSSTDLLPFGFKQRLALACATMHHPPLLFLDEPTSGVDPITRREFWNHINGLVEKGVTVLVTTHFMDEAEYCDRIALIYRGRVIKMDAPDALKQLCQNEIHPNPSLEEAFIQLIEEYDQSQPEMP